MSIDFEKLARRRQICDTLKEKLIESLDLPYLADDIAEDTALVGAGLGVDSLDVLEIVLCVENSFGVKMPSPATVHMRSINTLVDFIISEQSK